MLSKAEFEDLDVGDIIQAAALFKGLSAAPTNLLCVEVSPDKTAKRFDASYYGIRLGQWTCSLAQDQMKWTFA